MRNKISAAWCLPLTISLLFLWGCGGSGGASHSYDGKYTGQLALRPADISDVKEAKLSIPPLAEELKGVDIIKTLKQQEKLVEWYGKFAKEIKEAPKESRLSLQADCACQIANFVDLELLPKVLRPETELAAMYANEPNPREAYKVRSTVLGTLRQLFALDAYNGRPWSDREQEFRIYYYLKKTCPAYSDYLEVEENLLSEVDGYVDDETELAVLKAFLDRAQTRIRDLDEAERSAYYADVVCQILVRYDMEMPDNTASVTAMALDPKTEFKTKGLKLIEKAFSSEDLKRLGLWKSKLDERKFKKELKAMCPAYMDYAEMKKKGIIIGLNFSKKIFG